MRKVHYLVRYVNSSEEEGARWEEEGAREKKKFTPEKRKGHEKKKVYSTEEEGAREKNEVYDSPFVKNDFEYHILKTGLKKPPLKNILNTVLQWPSLKDCDYLQKYHAFWKTTIFLGPPLM